MHAIATFRNDLMRILSVRLLSLLLLAVVFHVTAIVDAASQGRPRTYCQCIERCEAGKQRCERNFDEDCKRTPRPANCEPSFRARCDQGAAVCSLDCSTAFQSTSC
jgi:hypothetical protein